MSQNQQSLLVYSYSITKERLLKFTRFLKALSTPVIDSVKPIISPIAERLDPYIQKSKQFYEENKLIILVVGAITITYLVVRPSKQVDNKEKKKKQSTGKRQLGNKIFISDNSEMENHQPSTGTRREVESSEREVVMKKKAENKFLERIQSSSQEEESGDKIFFEVYKTYQVSSAK